MDIKSIKYDETTELTYYYVKGTNKWIIEIYFVLADIMEIKYFLGDTEPTMLELYHIVSNIEIS